MVNLDGGSENIQLIPAYSCNQSMKFPMNRETTSTCLEIETSSLAR